MKRIDKAVIPHGEKKDNDENKKTGMFAALQKAGAEKLYKKRAAPRGSPAERLGLERSALVLAFVLVLILILVVILVLALVIVLILAAVLITVLIVHGTKPPFPDGYGPIVAGKRTLYAAERGWKRGEKIRKNIKNSA